MKTILWPDLKRDQDSHPELSGVVPGAVVLLVRDWASYRRGQRATVLELIPCVGGDFLRYNARVVLQGEPAGDPFFHRTMPAELLAPVWKVGETFTVNKNQGDRPASVLAVLGTEALVEYDMPGGKSFLLILDMTGGRDRSVSRKALPGKWKRELDQ
jgi:hypothetical protein